MHCTLTYCYDNFPVGLYLYSATESKLTVDTSRGERLHINVSAMLFPLPNLPIFLYFLVALTIFRKQAIEI